MLTYTAKQLVKYHAHCKANPKGHILPPGGKPYWDEMTATAWLNWFRTCLDTKTSRGTESQGNGNRARKRFLAMLDAKAECRWCGQRTEQHRKQFCDGDCRRSYNS